MTDLSSMSVFSEREKAYFKNLRRELHAIPELAYREKLTSDAVSSCLDEFGIEYVRGLAGTGIVARIQKGTCGRSIALRADMDALPIKEKNSFEYVSKNPGVMHACGHDGHMAMLLAAAKKLNEDTEFDGTVYLIFQPAEEGGAGAKRMIEDGLFDSFAIDRIFGMHNHPVEKFGTFMIKKGPVMAAVDTWRVTIHGRSGHSSQPHKALNPIVIASHIVLAIKSISSLSIDPSDAHVVTVAKMAGGTTFNIIPDQCTIEGSVRSFDENVQNMVESRIVEIAKNIAVSFGASADVEYNRMYPATVNSTIESALMAAERAGGTVCSDYPSSMGSEDFSYFLQHKEGCYVWLGSGREDMEDPPLHSSIYDFNDDLIPLGASYWIELVKAELPADR